MSDVDDDVYEDRNLAGVALVVSPRGTSATTVEGRLSRPSVRAWPPRGRVRPAHGGTVTPHCTEAHRLALSRHHE
ncbi:hypothetical protein GL213_14465 [Halogeometricum borinquense]|nr:hypothetical protein GL213_14465 [Halogeometricum borinquense]